MGILILGAKGMLGAQLQRLYPDATGWDREETDVTDAPAFERQLLALRPEAVVNCVAFNDVDGAESRPEAARCLNTEFPARLAGLTARLRIPLVHFSTNYVFDGAAGEYREEDEPAPLSAYGASKFEGERGVAAQGGQAYIVRTAVIFGPRGSSDLSKRSFVDLMLDLGRRSPVVKAVADEVNSVTYAPDLAAGVQALLRQAPPPGLYHLTNQGAASWYDFAREIFRLQHSQVRVEPVAATEFRRAARRPAKAVLRNTRLPLLRPWQEALQEYLSGMAL